MKTFSACEVIAKARGDAVLVSTMGAMFAFDRLGAAQPRLSSVPLMGGAPGLGLGLALARPEEKILVVDGDASLLMQLGGLVTVAEHEPRNFIHFVIHNGTQFSGLSNLALPGEARLDLCGMARAAGYRKVVRIDTRDALEAAIDDLIAGPGPTFVELRVEAVERRPGPAGQRQRRRVGDLDRRAAGEVVRQRGRDDGVERVAAAVEVHHDEQLVPEGRAGGGPQAAGHDGP
mgnify:CR=1 FL=1